MKRSYLLLIVIKNLKKQIVAIFDLNKTKQKTIKASNTNKHYSSHTGLLSTTKNTTQPNKQSMITIKPLS